ncbi:MAG TPA: glycoside hydrolase family 95 protein, partial [Candidatus Paceibacterota bacterium]|nr:glycoside hydrolase family 95 protein [Candidatus Paceibacterota bacterium]
MKNLLATSGVLFALAVPTFAADGSTLWYSEPATRWMTEALPIGNGTLGAMVFGGTEGEHLQFNVNSLWEGDEEDTGSYQAFGDVLIELNHANVSEYRRELDIDRAVHTVSYVCNGIHFKRTMFASHPAGVIMLRIEADKPGAISGRLWLTDMHGAETRPDAAARLHTTGKLKNGLDYEAQVLVIPGGGKGAGANAVSNATSTVKWPDWKSHLPPTGVAFTNCDALTVILAADTSYRQDQRHGWRGDHPHQAVTKRIDAAARAKFATLLRDHVADYQKLFHRVQFDLGKTAPEISALPTGARLAAYTRNHANDPELEALFAQYGRYLLIASSREGGLPANLQGLWNDSNNPPWRCDYHSNINIQMNYWPAEPGNLAECAVPFIDYVTSLREVAMRRTQAHYGGKRGYTFQTENNIYGGGSWRWNPPASAWYAQHLWEHYAFSGDKKYLADVAYPMLKEICQFW